MCVQVCVVGWVQCEGGCGWVGGCVGVCVWGVWVCVCVCVGGWKRVTVGWVGGCGWVGVYNQFTVLYKYHVVI